MRKSRIAIVPIVCVLVLLVGLPVKADLPSRVRRVNVPYFDGDISYSRTAIFWYGQVTRDTVYTDVRVGYNDAELYINLAVFDRLLWYDPSPDRTTLTEWDAATLYLGLDGPAGETANGRTLRLDAQLTWWEKPRTAWQAAHRSGSGVWEAAELPFTTEAGWRGDAPNNAEEDRGWVLTFHIPFSSLGLDGPPPQGTVWGLGLKTHNRNAGTAGATVSHTTWPEALEDNRPATWGQLAFGVPVHVSPTIPADTVTVRHKLNGATVLEGAVGGGSVCGNGLDYWTEWGQRHTAGETFFNVQNQSDVSDWPCFSKYYVTFPLDALPRGKEIASASLTLHNWGNAGEGWDPEPQPSYIQVLSVGEGWTPESLSWNGAPLARENLSGRWVSPVESYPGYPGFAYVWDVGRAVEEAYAAGEPVRLVVYSADSAYHSGRYFYSSATEDMNAEGRPTLSVSWGDPGNMPPPRLWLPLALR